MPLKKICDCCQLETFPRGRETAKLWGKISTSYTAEYVADPGPVQSLDHCAIQTTQLVDVV